MQLEPTLSSLGLLRTARQTAARRRCSPDSTEAPRTLANVARSRHYEWLKEPEYAAAFSEAREEAIETLEEQVWKSATGIEVPVIYQGQLCFEPRCALGMARSSETKQDGRSRARFRLRFASEAMSPRFPAQGSQAGEVPGQRKGQCGTIESRRAANAGRARLAKIGSRVRR